MRDSEEELELQDGQGLLEAQPAEAREAHWLRRLGRRKCAIAVLLLIVLLAPVPGLDSRSFLRGLLQNPGVRSLEVELQDAKDLPLVQLGHISDAAGSVLCVVDVAQSVGRLMGISLGINSVTLNCDFDAIARKQRSPVTQEQRQKCAVSIFGMLLNTALGMGAISSSISTCAGSINVPANCAANINAFIGNFLLIFNTAMAADLDCPQDPLQERVDAKLSDLAKKKEEIEHKVTKFLKEHGQDVAVLPGPPAVEKKKVYTSIASCVAALDLATTFVMKSGVIIADSTDHCAVDKVSDGVGDREDRQICSVDIIGLMGTLSLAIRFYALAANSCVEIVGDSVPSACAAAGAGLSAGVFATVAPAMNLQASCEKAFALWDPDTWPSDQNLRQSATKQAPKVQPEDQGFTVVADP